MAKISRDDLIVEVQDQLFVQDYVKQKLIDNVKIIDIKRMAGEDGTFEELVRLTSDGALEILPDFKLRQVNRSKLLGGATKAWHLHYNQEDVWYVSPDDHMLLGLWDIREKSPTCNLKMRIVLGAGNSRLVHIPRGVAHGVVNLSPKSGSIFYLVNQTFNQEAPDEQRLPWDAAGADFWTPEKG